MCEMRFEMGNSFFSLYTGVGNTWSAVAPIATKLVNVFCAEGNDRRPEGISGYL